MKKILSILSLSILLTVMLSSCGSRQKIVYLQGAETEGSWNNETPYEARIQPDDRLSILVTCSELSLAVPFNLQRPQASMQEGGGSYSSNFEDNENLYYRVDSRGNINFPTIGQLRVQGMTRSELSTYLQDYLREKGYIQDPIVNVAFTDAHFSVLGEVNSPGKKQMTREKVTLFEALAEAGDMTIYGERDKVRLLREAEGRQHYVTLNLKDPQIIASPYYYVRSGDVIYVEPSATRAANREVSSLSNYAISVTSILLTLTSLIITITK